MPNITAAFLNEIHTPLFTSPIDGKDYTVTNSAMVAANIHGMLMSGLRQQSLASYAKARQLELAAMAAQKVTAPADLMRDVLAAQAKIAFESVKGGAQEQPLLRQARHMLTDVLKLLDESAHAAYQAAKYAEGGTATDESRVKATTAAYVRLLELAFIPGLV